MEQEAFLIGFSQLSLVLTGFVSVFVAFFMGSEESTRPMIHHAASMLAGSLLSVITALSPIVLFHYGMKDEKLWYWSSVLGLAVGTVYFTYMLSLSIRLTRVEFKEAGLIHMLASYGLGFIAFGLLISNLISGAGPGHYVLASISMFMIAVIGFVTFSLQKVLKW